MYYVPVARPRRLKLIIVGILGRVLSNARNSAFGYFSAAQGIVLSIFQSLQRASLPQRNRQTTISCILSAADNFWVICAIRRVGTANEIDGEEHLHPNGSTDKKLTSLASLYPGNTGRFLMNRHRADGAPSPCVGLPPPQSFIFL